MITTLLEALKCLYYTMFPTDPFVPLSLRWRVLTTMIVNNSISQDLQLEDTISCKFPYLFIFVTPQITELRLVKLKLV